MCVTATSDLALNLSCAALKIRPSVNLVVVGSEFWSDKAQTDESALTARHLFSI